MGKNMTQQPGNEQLQLHKLSRKDGSMNKKGNRWLPQVEERGMGDTDDGD